MKALKTFFMYMNLIIRAIIVWPIVACVQVVLLFAMMFILCLCVPVQWQHVIFFIERYETGFEVISIIIHCGGLWLCAVVAYGFFRGILVVGKMYKIVVCGM